MCPVGCLWDLGVFPLESALLECWSRFCPRVPVRRRRIVTCGSSFNQVLFLSWLCVGCMFYTPLLGVKVFRNITTFLASFMVICLVKLEKGRLAWCARMCSLINCICLSTSGTWSRASVLLRVVLTTFSSSDYNSGSTNILNTCKPCDL